MNQTMDEPQQEGNILDSLFGDGTKSQDASDPLRTVGDFFNVSVAIGAAGAILNIGEMAPDILSNSMDGGLDGLQPTPIESPAPSMDTTLDAQNDANFNGFNPLTPPGMAG